MNHITREILDRVATSLAESDLPPSAEALAGAPLLEAWAPVLAMLRPCLMGRVCAHPDHEDGDDHQTSPILSFDEEAGFARSVDRWYRLGTSIYEADPDLVRHMQAKASPYLQLAEADCFIPAIYEERRRAHRVIQNHLDA